MEKDFDKWNDVKKQTNKKYIIPSAHERELWWVCFGLNVGVEIDGKHENYERPAIVIKKFNNEMIWVLPTTAQDKGAKFHQKFNFGDQEFFVALTQIRTISTKRLLRKSGMISKTDFDLIIKRICVFFQTHKDPLLADLLGGRSHNHI